MRNPSHDFDLGRLLPTIAFQEFGHNKALASLLQLCVAPFVLPRYETVRDHLATTHIIHRVVAHLGRLLLLHLLHLPDQVRVVDYG